MEERRIHFNTPEALALRCCKGHTVVKEIGHNKFAWVKFDVIGHLRRLT